MEKAADYRSLSRLVMAQIRPGVVTNNFMDKSDYLSEIESGTLYYHAYEGGLLLFRRRRGFSLMNYYLTDPEILPKLTEGEILLTEPVLRPEDDGETVLRFLKDLGFETLFHRERFVRQEEMSSGRQEEAAGAEERENVTAAREADFRRFRGGLLAQMAYHSGFLDAGLCILSDLSVETVHEAGKVQQKTFQRSLRKDSAHVAGDFYRLSDHRYLARLRSEIYRLRFLERYYHHSVSPAGTDL